MSKKFSHKNNKSLFPNQPLDTEDEENWQVSYLDIVTIVLGFLIILLSVSKLSTTEISSITQLYESSDNETEFITTPIEEIKQKLEAQLSKEIEQGKLEIVRDLNDIRIRFSSDELYRSGSATLQDGVKVLLNRVLSAILNIRYNDFNIDVEGHTDNYPISSTAYPSNWELSTARASNIVKHFAEMGVEETRLKASGYAATQPRAPNNDSLGYPIPENMDMNRRIVLRLYYSSLEKKPVKEDITKVPNVAATPSCNYSVQVGGYLYLSSSLIAAEEAATKTGHEFEIAYNKKLFSVRTAESPSIEKMLNVHRNISSQLNEPTIGLINRCYSDTADKAAPSTLKYQIQLGAFPNIDGAQSYTKDLFEDFQISAHIQQMSPNNYTVLTGPYENRSAAWRQLNLYKEKQVSPNLTLSYLPESVVEYKFDAQILVADFSSKPESEILADRISKQFNVATTVKEINGNTYFVLSEKFMNWPEALSLFNHLQESDLNLSPVIFLLEYS